MTRFKRLRVENRLDEAAKYLKKHKLNEAEVSYRKALEVLDIPEFRERVRGELEHYFEDRLKFKEWARADRALTILQNLRVIDSTTLISLTDRLHLSQAKVALETKNIETACTHLKLLCEQAPNKIKSCIYTYIQDKERQRQWALGNFALKHLVKLLDDDTLARDWRANWLFTWAKALLSTGEAHQKSIPAKCLCQKILEFARKETPVINWQANIDATDDSNAPNLQYQTSVLFDKYLLMQAQTYLNQPDLAQAESFFQVVLSLPFRPERQALVSLALDQARYALQADQPDQAFSLLRYLDFELNKAECKKFKDLFYQFSCLYAGRDCWAKGQEAFKNLCKWYKPAKDIDQLLDDLNREWLDFVKANRPVVSTLSIKELEHQVLEVHVAKQALKDAEERSLDTQYWTDQFIAANLALGQAYLTNYYLGDAIRSYQEILNLTSHRTGYKNQISQSLYNYSERMLNLKPPNWYEARQALNSLEKLFNPETLNGEIPSDPRIVGAIQRVLLDQAQTKLSRNQVKEAFILLKELPPPWPVGKVKEMIWNYKQTPDNGDEWLNRIEALRRLDKLLAKEKERPGRDQEVLQWLVNTLTQRGKYLREQRGDLEKAAVAYCHALLLTREQVTRRRSTELANEYIQVALQIAQNYLNNDLQTVEITYALEDAVKWYRKILNVSEHHKRHEQAVNDTLANHAEKLVNTFGWPQAHEKVHRTLNELDDLYRHQPRSEKYKPGFADLRSKLVIAEVQVYLEHEQLEEAFKQLTWLKDWLDKYGASGVNWTDNSGRVNEVYSQYHRTWLAQSRWNLAKLAIKRLSVLLPDDSRVKGYKGEYLYFKGWWLEKKNRLKYALKFYTLALTKVPGQSAIAKSDIHRRIEATKFRQARQYLTEDRLEEALGIYDQIQEGSGGHSNRENGIRRALKIYSESQVKQDDPKWERARQVLEYLQKLYPNNPQVLEWRQRLTFRKMKAALYEPGNNIQAAFAIFATMPPNWPLDEIPDWLLEEIKTIFHDYSQDRARTDTVRPQSIEVLRELGFSFAKHTAVREWVASELTDLGNIFERQNNVQGFRDAYAAAVEFG